MKLMKTKTKRMLLLIGGMSAIALAATVAGTADLQPMIVNTLTGNLRIQQSIPCASNVDQTTPVTAGRLELSPADGVDVPGGKIFSLTRVNVSFAPFTIHRSCVGLFDRTKDYTNVAVQLASAVSFTAVSSGPGVYAVSIPTEDFLVYETAVVNGEVETGTKHPKVPVTGTIDLINGTVHMVVAVATKFHFKALCDPIFDVCVYDDDYHGTLTATLDGTIAFPDSDHDGVPDKTDNCRFVANPDQTPVVTPAITAPAGLTIASCADHHIGLASASDICDAGPVSVTNNAPAMFDLGANLVTWKAVDAKGRFGTSPQTVTVVDTTPPIITSVPPPIALNDCKAADLGVPTATDDCAGTPTFANNAPAKFPVGPTVVTWTASDVSGNHATATQTVTVTDTVAPTVACVPDGPPGGSFRVTGIDACGAPTIRLGSFVLANGEKIKINETGKSGVSLINVIGPEHIKHFHVGKGQAVITATDGSGNVTSAICR
jgi:hypothetical protein